MRDWVAAGITLRRGLTGAKPEAFVAWLFDLLGVQGNDEVTDLFPGTGVVGRTRKRLQEYHGLLGPEVVASGRALNGAGEQGVAPST